MIADKFGREINYLRLSVTDRCNLRCSYCMPEFGMKFAAKDQILSYEEMLKLAQVLSVEGVNKIRITGGEPFVRRDLIHFLESLSQFPKLDTISITSNGILLPKYLKQLHKIGIKSVNLSLDTVDRENFKRITRRDQLPQVLKALDEMVEMDFKVKINAVAMKGANTHELHHLVELGRKRAIEVRFIEEMPFNGSGAYSKDGVWKLADIQSELLRHFPDMLQIKASANSTARLYRIPGFAGTVGIIPAYTRTICGDCNRIRLTAEGKLLTCLYQQGGHDLKSVLRSGASDADILDFVKQAVSLKPKDGFEAEKQRTSLVSESMSSIGG